MAPSKIAAGLCLSLVTLFPFSSALAQPVVSNAAPNVSASPIPRIMPEALPGVAPEKRQAVPTTPSAAVPATPVVVRRVLIEGASVYPQAVLAPFATGLVGPATTLSRIEQARLEVLNQYRSHGYVLTTVSARLEADGTLRLNVVEGRVAEVKLEGDIGPAATQVLRFLNHLTESPALNNADLERWLLLANDIPGVTVKTVLRPSATEPGALTLVAQLTRQKFSALATADNRAFRQTGPVESLLTLDANSFTEFGEKTEVSLYHTSGNTQNFGQASEDFFIGGSGLRIRLYAGHGVADPSGFLRSIDYEGDTTVGGVALSYPVIRSRDESLTLSTNFDIIQSTIRSAAGVGDESARSGEDDLQIWRIGGDYALDDVLAGDARPAANVAQVRLSQGLNFLGGTQDNSATASRPNEKTGFTKITGELSRTQTLFAPWQGATVALLGRIDGQYSNDVLPPAEKFFLGGPVFTRGFYTGEVTGDRAYAATAELQLNTGFNTTLFGKPFQATSQFYAFYDRGEAWQSQAQDLNARLSSEGVGVRAFLTRYMEVDLEGDIRNTRRPSGSSTVAAENGDAFFWRVLVRY